MAMTARTNDRTYSIAVTLRPRPLLQKHEKLLMKWLQKHAAQWEFFEETVDNDPTTRHLHGRVLFPESRRMDKLKSGLIKFLDLVLAEKKVFQKGIRWLYDDWEYAGKDGHVWHRNITDEDEWVYADPANKYEKKKNADINHWLSYIEEDLGPQTTEEEVKRLISVHMALDRLEMPALDQLKKKCQRVSYYWNVKQNLDSTLMDAD